MTHPDVTIARSRATEDAIAGRYDNRESSHAAKVAYDTKHASLSRSIEAINEALATDQDVHNAPLNHNGAKQ